jgi:hypothetical protein
VYIGEVEQDSLLNGYEVKNPLKSLTSEQIMAKGIATHKSKDATVVRFPDKYCVIFPPTKK